MRRGEVAAVVLLAGLLWASTGWAQPEGELESTSGTAQADPDADIEEQAEWGEEPGWWLDPYGFIRAGYEYVQSDENFDYIGENNGFVLHNARLGITGGNEAWGFTFQLSFEGTEDVRESVNTPQGDLVVRLKDAYIREQMCSLCPGVTIGQFKLPFSAEELRSTADLAFVSRAVGLEGVLVGRGQEQPGIEVGRDLGVMISSGDPLRFGDFGVGYYVAAANGNGRNQLLNDNNALAVVARLELYWADLVRLGGSFLLNDRTVGTLPNLYEEEDLGFSGDLLVNWEGLEVSGQLTTMTTEFATTGAADREQLAYHAQVSYRFDQLGVPFAPAYRFAYFHPRAEGGVTEGGVDLDSFELMYHTIGLRVWEETLVPITTYINYTFTGEQAPREVDNDLLEVMVQLIF